MASAVDIISPPSFYRLKS